VSTPLILVNTLFLHVLRSQYVVVLSELQAEMLNPLLDLVEKEFGHRPSHSSSILVDNQPDEVVEALEKALREADNWQLTAVDALSAASKSLVVAMAVSRGRLSIDEAIQIIRLEEDFQVSFEII
jgi:ATP synthase F1 complex assembly factor 2